MSDDPLRPLLERVARAARATSARAGRVTAIDAETMSMTVDCAGEEIPGVRWYAHYSPQVGDYVDLLCVDGASWRALGALATDWNAPPAQYGEETITADALYIGTLSSAYNPHPWEWILYPSGDVYGAQGRYYNEVGPDLIDDWTFATVWHMPALAAALPDGATVQSVKLRVTRGWPWGVTGPVLPFIQRHTYTGAPSGAPSLIGTAWTPGGLAHNETAKWDLPSEWLTDWLAGDIEGFAIYSPRYQDYARFSLAAVVAYTTPA